MRVGSNRCPYLKFMAHVPLFLSAKICESRVLTKNFQIYYTNKVYPLAFIIEGYRGYTFFIYLFCLFQSAQQIRPHQVS